MKERNYTVDLWRFIFTIVLSFGHFNEFGCKMGLRMDAESFIFKGDHQLAFFLLLSGYFMMAAFQSKKNRLGGAPMSAGREAWGYFGKRYLALAPVLFIGALMDFIIQNIQNKTPVKELFYLFIGSLQYFLGIDQTYYVAGGSRINQAIEAGTYSVVWNGPLWYLSAMIIAGLILYYILCKSEGFFTAVFAPIAFIGIYFTNQVYVTNNPPAPGFPVAQFTKGGVGWLGLPNGILRCIGGMCIGALMWYAVNYFKKKGFTVKGKAALTVVNILMTIFILYIVWFSTPLNDFQEALVIVFFLLIILTCEDGFSRLLNRRCFNFLGKLALYFYVCHEPVVNVIIKAFPTMAYLPLAGVFVVITFIGALILYFIDTKVIEAILRKPIKNYIAK